MYFAPVVLQDNAEVVQAAFVQLLIQDDDSKSHHNFKSYHISKSHRGTKANKKARKKLIHKLASKQVLVPSHVIHVASTCKLQWNQGMSELIEPDYSVLESKDEATGLPPFMTYASNSSKSQNRVDLNTLFEMVKKYPKSVRLLNTTNKKRDVMKKRDNEMTTDAYYDGTKR